MTTVYIKQNGVKVTVEVTDEMADQLRQTRRKIWRSEYKARYHTTSLDGIEENGSIFADPMLSMEDLLIDREDKAEEMSRLKQAMTKLTPEQREIIRMRFEEQMELEEIGDVIGITYQAVQQRIETILKKIKKVF